MSGLYTTHYEDGTPVQRNTLLSLELPSRPGPNILTLLLLMMQSKLTNPAMLATLMPAKWSPDILVDMYSRASKRIVYESPSFSTNERIAQAMRESLRQQVRDKYGVFIPGTHDSSQLPVPFMTPDDENALKNMLSMNGDDETSEDVSKEKKKGTKKSDAIKSVAGTTAAWVNKVKNLLISHRYKKNTDIVVADTLIMDFVPRKGVRNPDLYPKISFVCSSNGAFIFDIFINTDRLNVFSYGTQLPHQITAPPSVLQSGFNGMLTSMEFSEYQRGLALAYLKIRETANHARKEDDRTKTLPQVAKKD
jgi:hypothetical protein